MCANHVKPKCVESCQELSICIERDVFTVETVKDPIHISSVQETLMANIHKGPPVNSPPPTSFVNTTNENIMIKIAIAEVLV